MSEFEVEDNSESHKIQNKQESSTEAGVTKQFETLEVHANIFSVLSAIIFCSVLGCSIRVAISDEVNQVVPLFTYTWPNFLGSLVLGFVTKRAPKLNRISSSLSTGVASGFCGSLTTFSTFQFAASGLILKTSLPLNVLVYKWFDIQLVGIAVPLLGVSCGYHLSLLLTPLMGPEEFLNINICVEYKQANIGDYFYIAMGTLTICIVITCTAILTDSFTFALCFAPIGAILRWRLSLLNSRIENFPVGTFIANLAGSIFLALSHLVVLLLKVDDMSTYYSVYNGFAEGFCGSLTTMSTLALELHKLDVRPAYIYIFVSIVSTQLIMIIILGSSVWSSS